jgi:hypothetical protein
MILLAISATNFTELSKIRCIFVEISERILQFILDFFAFGEKIEELDSRASPSQHLFFQQIKSGLGRGSPNAKPQSFFTFGEKRLVKKFFSKPYYSIKNNVTVEGFEPSTLRAEI